MNCACISKVSSVKLGQFSGGTDVWEILKQILVKLEPASGPDTLLQRDNFTTGINNIVGVWLDCSRPPLAPRLPSPLVSPFCARVQISRDSLCAPAQLQRSALPPPPQFNVEASSYQSGEATQLFTGEEGGDGIISSFHMTNNVSEWSTEFVVRVLYVTVDYEAVFQLILTRIVGLACSVGLSNKINLVTVRGNTRTWTLFNNSSYLSSGLLWTNSMTICGHAQGTRTVEQVFRLIPHSAISSSSSSEHPHSFTVEPPVSGHPRDRVEVSANGRCPLTGGCMS